MIRRAIIGLIVLIPRPSEAHPLDTTLSPISDDAVRIGQGLATRDEQGRWRFVCPTTWGGPPAPLALRLGDDRILVIGNQDAFEMTLEGVATPLGVGLEEPTTHELERVGDRVLALAYDPSGSAIAAFEPGTADRIVESERWLHSIEGSDEGFVVTSSAAGGIRIETRGLDGREIGSSFVPYPDVATATVGIERAAGDMFAVILQPDQYLLARIDVDRLQLIASSFAPILGPIRAGSEIWFVQDGALLRVAGAEVEVVDQSQPYSCLDEDGGVVRACIGTQIFELEPGADRELVFSLSEVKGPRLQHLDPEARIDCEFEWNIFANEAGLDPTIPDGVDPPPDPGCACTVGARRSHSLAWWLVLVCLLPIRRSASAPGSDRPPRDPPHRRERCGRSARAPGGRLRRR